MSTLHAAQSESQVREVLSLPEGERLRRLEGVPAVLHVKGAPERILAACSHHMVDGERKPLSEYDRRQYLFRNQELATRALRVIGFAVREFRGDVPPLKEETLETDLTFLGLAGMMDAPRSDAIEAIRRCKKAGIRVVMITGDHKLTAMAVAREMGILGEGDLAFTGEELERMPDDELVRQVERIRVYARVAPEHKMRIVDAWKKAGHIVAMTGDGVNDAPALKRSDLGVAMGITGTDVAKESADMVLTDDNFASIVAAVEEGRGIYENIRKFVAFLLSANAGEVLIMFIATLAIADPSFLPFFAPVQLLWINLVTDGLPALALGVDPYPTDIMDPSPQSEGGRALPGHCLPDRRGVGDFDGRHPRGLLPGTAGEGRRHPSPHGRLHDDRVLRTLPRVRDAVSAPDDLADRPVHEHETDRRRARVDGAAGRRDLYAVPARRLPNGAAHAPRLARDGPDLVHGIRLRRRAQGPSTSDESPRAMIEVDGGHGEGGGQLLRMAVALSALTETPVRVVRIRAGRPTPGLAAQHVTAINAVAALCKAEVTNASLGASSIEFRPGKLAAGRFSFDGGTAGSITLGLQSLLPVAAAAPGVVRLRL